MKPKPRHLHVEGDIKMLKELRNLIYQKVGSLPNRRLWYPKIKLLLLPVLFFGTYFVALINAEKYWIFLLSFALMGMILVFIFHNLLHELAHSNIFKNPKYNAYAYYLFDLLGANSYIWKIRHIRLHHAFPNVNGWDADVEDKGPIVIFPEDTKESYKKHQWWYAFFLYPLFLLNWMLVRDFKDYFLSDRIISKVVTIPRREYIKLFTFKFFNIFILILAPWLFTSLSFLQALFAFLLMTVSGSLLALVTLLTPHVNEENEFPLADENGVIPYSWFRHQLLSTNDMTTTNWFMRHLMGNSNYHLIHHLCPRLSYVYFPEATQVMKNYLVAHQLPYKSYTIWDALKKHYQLIRSNALHINQLDF